MHFSGTVLLLGLGAFCEASPVRSGHAGAEWLSSSATCEPGATVRTAIRLVIDPGWHTYWTNPGEGGMPTSVEWKLPAGWTADGVSHPPPVRMKTGGLPGFGHEGTLLLPVSLTAPKDFTGTAKLEAEVSWLACNDDACVPGDVKLALELRSGPARAGNDEAAIIASLKKIPKTLPGNLLDVADKAKSLKLSIHPPDGENRDLTIYQVFPETPRVIDPAAEIRFTRVENHWIAEAAKSEYLTGEPKELALVLADPNTGEAFRIVWRKP